MRYQQSTTVKYNTTEKYYSIIYYYKHYMEKKFLPEKFGTLLFSLLPVDVLH